MKAASFSTSRMNRASDWMESTCAEGGRVLESIDKQDEQRPWLDGMHLSGGCGTSGRAGSGEVRGRCMLCKLEVQPNAGPSFHCPTTFLCPLPCRCLGGWPCPRRPCAGSRLGRHPPGTSGGPPPHPSRMPPLQGKAYWKRWVRLAPSRNARWHATMPSFKASTAFCALRNGWCAQRLGSVQRHQPSTNTGLTCTGRIVGSPACNHS